MSLRRPYGTPEFIWAVRVPHAEARGYQTLRLRRANQDITYAAINKVHVFIGLLVTTEQLAEKWRTQDEPWREVPAGAKARLICSVFGTTKVVP